MRDHPQTRCPMDECCAVALMAAHNAKLRKSQSRGGASPGATSTGKSARHHGRQQWETKARGAKRCGNVLARAEACGPSAVKPNTESIRERHDTRCRLARQQIARATHGEAVRTHASASAWSRAYESAYDRGDGVLLTTARRAVQPRSMVGLEPAGATARSRLLALGRGGRQDPEGTEQSLHRQG